jgi:hypothetical protein
MKLYWRYKKDGKWTWKPATWNSKGHIEITPPVVTVTEEEE